MPNIEHAASRRTDLGADDDISRFASSFVGAWKLLLFVPLLVAAVAFVASLLIPQHFKSRAVLEVDLRQAKRVTDFDILDAAAPHINSAEGRTQESPLSSMDLAGRISVVPYTQNLTGFFFEGSTAEEAELIGRIVMEEFYSSTRPNAARAQQLSDQLSTNRDIVLSYMKGIDRDKTFMAKYARKEAGDDALVKDGLQTAASRYLSNVMLEIQRRITANIGDLQSRITRIEGRLQGLGEETVVLKPDKPTSPVDRLHAGLTYAALAGIVAFWLLWGLHCFWVRFQTAEPTL